MYKIRQGEKGDFPLIRELALQVWPQTYASLLSPAQITYMLELMYSETALAKQIQDGAEFIILENKDIPSGFASFGETEKDVYKLHKIYVLITEQGKGSGRFLIQHILDTIRARGAASLQLQVNRQNRAREFYEKLGFSIIREVDLDIGNGYFMRDFIMEKKITS